MDTNDLTQQYMASLEDYVTGMGEAALKRAYDIGRDAVEHGYGALDLLKIHEASFENLLSQTASTDDLSVKVRLASQFLAESLAPYEMTHRGFQEALAQLKSRAEELKSINKKLQDEIIERKQIERALRESEERYRLLVETARDVIYTISTDGRITSLNRAFEEVTGWSRTEWLGKPFHPIIHPEDLPLVAAMLERVLKGESASVFELRILSKTRDIVIGEFISTPQFRNGVVVGALGIARDITARKRIEQKLRENEDLFRVITGNITDLIAILDTQGRRLYNSPSYQPVLGDPQALKGTDSFAEVHPDDRERIKGVFRRTVATGVGHRDEYRLSTKDGKFRHIESQGNVIRNDEGKIERVVVVSRDITERKLADERLKHSQKQLAAAQQMAHIGSWEWDIIKNRVSWSDELYRIYGITAKEFSGSYDAFLERIHPEDRERVRTHIEQSYRSKRPFLFEHRIIVPDGTIRYLEGHGEIIVNEQGEPVRILGAGQDITERKQAEKALRGLAKRVVEAQEEERKRIARELHDDVSQLLTAAKLQMEVLEDEVPMRKSKIGRKLQSIRKQVTGLINEIRRISANLRPAALDDLGLVTALQVLCREFEQGYGLKVKFEATGFSRNETDPHVETTLYRIVQEALSNIAKHAHAKKVSLRLKCAANILTLSVHDDGKGFEIEKQLQRKYQTGFGLIGMRERAQLIGGVFELESALNRGTSIHVEIPISSTVNHEKD